MSRLGRKLVGGSTLVVAMLAFGSSAAAGTHALADRTYYAQVPKTNVAVLVKTDPIPKNKPGGAPAKTGVIALECNVQLARVNPKFAFTPRGSFLNRTDWLFSQWGNTGNGTFDAFGRVVPFSGGRRIKVTLTATQVPTCFNVRPQTLTLNLAGRKVTRRLGFELAQGVHTPTTITRSCPASSFFGNQVTITGTISPDTGGTGVSLLLSTSNPASPVQLVTVPTAADGSFSYRFTPSPTSAPAYAQNVVINVAAGWGRDPASAGCSWLVGAPPG